MKNMDQALLREWVDLDLDGELPTASKETLRQEMSKHPELLQERQSLESLHGMLRETKMDARPQFADQVMAALPVAAWEKNSAPGRVPVWALPVALVVLMGTASSLILSSNLSGHHVLETGLMLADLMKTSVLAGSGLLFATWRGMGFGVEEMVADSTLNLAAFGALVLCLNLLFVSLLRRRPAVARASAEAPDDRSTSS